MLLFIILKFYVEKGNQLIGNLWNLFVKFYLISKFVAIIEENVLLLVIF